MEVKTKGWSQNALKQSSLSTTDIGIGQYFVVAVVQWLQNEDEAKRFVAS